MHYTHSHVESQARAGTVVEAEAWAGGACVIILCGGHATKSSEKLTDRSDYAGA